MMLLDDSEARFQAMSVIDKTDEKAVLAVIEPLKTKMDDIQREIEFYTEEREPGMICYWALAMKRVQQEFDGLTEGTGIDDAGFHGCLEILKQKKHQPHYLGLPVQVDHSATMEGHHIRKTAEDLLAAGQRIGENFVLFMSSHDFVQLELRGEIEWSHG